MITYMGFCGKDGSKDCSQVDSSSVKWFKIDEAGAKKDGHWYLEELSMSPLSTLHVAYMLTHLQ